MHQAEVNLIDFFLKINNFATLGKTKYIQLNSYFSNFINIKMRLTLRVVEILKNSIYFQKIENFKTLG